MSNWRVFFVTMLLVSTPRPLLAGIAYKLRVEGRTGAHLFTISAEGMSVRSEVEPSGNLSEFQRQYPIVISTDGGKVQRYLRPEDKTWYEQSNDKARGSIAIGTNPRVLQPAISMTEEASSDVIGGQRTRRYVLKTSFVIESEIGTEKVSLHKTSTVLLWVVAIDCAPKVAAQFGYMHFGIKDIDDAIALKLSTIEGLIIRATESDTERYEGGALRTFLTNTDVIDSRCVALGPELFQVPKGYQHREPIIGAP